MGAQGRRSSSESREPHDALTELLCTWTATGIHLLCCTQKDCLVGQWAAANIAKNEDLLVLGVSHERVVQAVDLDVDLQDSS